MGLENPHRVAVPISIKTWKNTIYSRSVWHGEVQIATLILCNFNVWIEAIASKNGSMLEISDSSSA